MPYVVNETCIKCKLMDCVDVCPVDCFYEGENMLVINPDECIDCGLCEPECPVDAIRGEDEADPYWIEMNAKLCYERDWDMIDEEKPPMEGYEEAAKITDKKDRLKISYVEIR